jgi:ribosome biogenesis GTPase
MAKRRLSRQQIRRIQKTREARREAARERAGRTTGDMEIPGPATDLPGLIITSFGHTLVLEDTDGMLHRCVARRTLETPVCGDRVYWQPTAGGQGVIVAVEPRRSVLARPDYSGRIKPLAANIDEVLVVVAPRPEPSESMVDRYLAAVETMGVEALIVVNKADLLEDRARDVLLRRLAVYQTIGYRLITVSSKLGKGMETLAETLRGGTGILLGQSGVGKSSLVKALLPHRKIATRAISETTGLGTHTTTNATLYHLETGGDLIDSPGVRGFEPALSAEQIATGYRELAPFLGRCKFSNCSHTVEPGCALREAVDTGSVDPRRFQSFLDGLAASNARAGAKRPVKHPS